MNQIKKIYDRQGLGQSWKVLTMWLYVAQDQNQTAMKSQNSNLKSQQDQNHPHLTRGQGDKNSLDRCSYMITYS